MKLRTCLLYSETCLQGTPQYPMQNVSLHDRYLDMDKIGQRFEQMSPDHRVSSHWSVP